MRLQTRIVVLSLGLMLCAVQASAATIAEVKEVDQNGIPVMIGQVVTVSGLVTVRNGTFSARDLDIHVQDETAGIYVYLRDGSFLKAALGDSVVVTGIVDQDGRTPRRNDTQITLTSASGLKVVGKSTPPPPLVVTAGELAALAEPPLEAYEGLLVRVENLSINPADWPAAGAEKFITATDGTGDLLMRIDRDTDIPGSQVPANPFIAIGVIIQDSTNPFGGYRLWPRSRYSDFLVMGNGSGLASVDPRTVETDEGEFALKVRLDGNGLDTITSFEIDLPLADGWGWEAASGNVSLSGPGLEGAGFELTAAGVSVSSAAIRDGKSYGVVTFDGVTPPGAAAASEVEIRTSVDGETFAPVALYPVIEALLPLPDVVVNEVYPNDGFNAQSSAFIEIKNRSDWTASLGGFTLSDLRNATYCDPAARITFGAADTIPAGGYLVVAESQAGFSERFGADPDVVAAISPLGRVGGDGATAGGVGAYEAVVLWRGAVSGSLIDYCEYKSPLLVSRDICEDLGGEDDAFPIVPPIAYSLARDEHAGDTGASSIDFVMSSEPTPGGENVTADNAPPSIEKVVAHSRDVIEVYLNEPCDSAALADLAVYEVAGQKPLAAYVSLSLQKVALLFEGLTPGAAATLSMSLIRDISGNSGPGLMNFTTSTALATRMCEVQEFDERGYSPLLLKVVTVIGFVTVPYGTFQPQYNSIYIQGLDGCGINVFSYDPPNPNPRLGDLVKVTGEIQEYVSGTAGATTELYMASPSSERLLSSFYPEPAPAVMKTGEIGREANEGKLVGTEGAIVSANDFGFYVDDGSGGVQVYQNYTDIDYTQFRVGMYVRVKGVILQYDRTLPFLEDYELVPRWAADIVVVDDAYPDNAALDIEPRVFCPSCGEDGFTVRFATPSAAQVTLRIFDGKGRLVTTLFSGMSVGAGEKVWDGRQPGGEPVPPGLYVCFLDSVEGVTGRKTTDSAPIVVGVELK